VRVTGRSTSPRRWAAALEQGWDLVPGDNFGVDEYDADGDGTNVGFHIANPWFRVNTADDNFWGGEWPAGAQVTITIGDPVRLTLKSRRMSMRREFGVGSDGFDVQAGISSP